jgi:Ca2+/Na+ antiporter
LTDYSGLFGWWISSITFNIVFVILASIYLYRRRNREPGVQTSGGIKQWVKDFTFVWILLSLLVLYVVSIGEGSYLLFATGNIVVELVLIVYVLKSGKSSHESTTPQVRQPPTSK